MCPPLVVLVVGVAVVVAGGGVLDGRSAHLDSVARLERRTLEGRRDLAHRFHLWRAEDDDARILATQRRRAKDRRDRVDVVRAAQVPRRVRARKVAHVDAHQEVARRQQPVERQAR
eukprot:1219064-Prymnesium_polylepis.1